MDADENYYFIEMNPRIQVEHTVTEEVTGIDIVQAQILIEEGYPLDSPEIGIKSQDDIHSNGYAIQLRVTTEDPANNFLPDTGKISVYRSPAGNGIRLDGGTAHTGAEITPYYDSLLVKIIAHDRTFEGVTRKAVRAIKETRIRGVKTNIPFLINVLQSDVWNAGKCTTTFIEKHPNCSISYWAKTEQLRLQNLSVIRSLTNLEVTNPNLIPLCLLPSDRTKMAKPSL